MPRVKRGMMAHKRHKKVLDRAKGYWGGKHKLFKTAHESVMRALRYAYRDRRNKKRDFRRLWIARINAAARLNEMTYSRFIDGLTKAGVLIDRKILSDMAINDAAGFSALVEKAKAQLKA